MQTDPVSVTIVAYNSRPLIRPCLEAVFRQDYRPLEVIVVDNASRDGTWDELERYRDRITLIENRRNLGFAAGQNQAIGRSRGRWVLTLNPDVVLLGGFIRRLVEAASLDSRAGTVCGKLLRMGRDLVAHGEPRIDSTGIYFTPEMRHFDRGWNEPDDGRYERAEYVFGACAAAALYRREMIEEISFEDAFFDPAFFAYREDADVAWRAQLLGWRAIYSPGAVGYHVRSVIPGPRRATPAALRMHSVKNRFLMRINNVTAGLYRRIWMRATARDLLVLGGCLLSEPSSLPAFARLAGCLGRALERRRWILQRKKVSDEYLAIWFQGNAQSHPLEAGSAEAAASGVVENPLAGSLP